VEIDENMRSGGGADPVGGCAIFEGDGIGSKASFLAKGGIG
jgi:hypothetical protein